MVCGRSILPPPRIPAVLRLGGTLPPACRSPLRSKRHRGFRIRPLHLPNPRLVLFRKRATPAGSAGVLPSRSSWSLFPAAGAVPPSFPATVLRCAALTPPVAWGIVGGRGAFAHVRVRVRREARGDRARADQLCGAGSSSSSSGGGSGSPARPCPCPPDLAVVGEAEWHVCAAGSWRCLA